MKSFHEPVISRASFLHAGRQEEERDCHDDEEDLDGPGIFFRRMARERAVSMSGTPDGQESDDQRRTERSASAESQRGPQEKEDKPAIQYRVGRRDLVI